MSDAIPDQPSEQHMPDKPIRGPYRPDPTRRRVRATVSIDGPPTAEELAQQHHRGDDADRLSLYTPEQIELDTRTVRIEITFDDVIKVRDQAEMIVAAMQLIIGKTRHHDIGSIRQRIECRREAGSLGARLAMFNGKTPYGFSRKKR